MRAGRGSDSLFCEARGSGLVVDYKTEADRRYITLETVDVDAAVPAGIH